MSHEQVVICDTCAHTGHGPEGAAWCAHLNTMGVCAKTTSCMNMCGQPVSFAMQAPDKPTYIFANAHPNADTDDLIALFGLYQNALGGEITNARSAGRLRHCLVAKIPPL